MKLIYGPRGTGRHRQARAWLLTFASLALVFAAAGSAAPAGPTDLQIAKTDSPDPVRVGSTLTYTIAVENRGPFAAARVVVTDRLPRGVDLVSATGPLGQCALKGRKVSCDLGEVVFGDVRYNPPTVTIAVIPRQPGTVTNTASVKSEKKDPVPSNSTATTTTRVLAAVTCRRTPATIVGTTGDDVLVGTGGPDVIASLGGDDTIRSLAGQDLVCAGSGDDYVAAGTAADRVFGGAGSDRLPGRGGPDLLEGGAGSDVLAGNRGADRLRGGRGFDRCRGGAGRDSIRSCER